MRDPVSGMRTAVLACSLLMASSVPAGAQPAGAAASEIDLPAFVDTLDRLAAAIEHATPPDITRVLTGVPSRLRVRSGEQLFDVPLEPFAQDLARARSDSGQWPDRRRTIHARLLDMKAEAEALLNEAPPVADSSFHGTLAGVLARKEFARHNPSTWTARLRQRIQDWLRGLWDSIGGNRLNSRRIAVTLAWLSVLAALTALLVWLARSSGRAVRTQSLRIGAADGPPPPAREWALRALAAMRAGHTSEAVRLAYRAALQRLEDQGAWRIDDARTAREYASLLPSGDTRSDVFRDIARQLEQVLYANRTVAAGDVARLADHLEALGCVRAHERAI